MDLLLSRYSNICYVLEMDWKSGFDLIFKGYEKQAEERIWQMWLARYPHMNKDNFVTYNDFKEKMKPQEPIKQHSKEELLKLYFDMRFKQNENI